MAPEMLGPWSGPTAEGNSKRYDSAARRKGTDMTDQNPSTQPKNHGSAPQEAANRPATAVAAAAAQAGKQLQKVAGSTERLARNHPWVAGAALLGAGAILGALAQRFFGHRPTVSELLGIDRLPRRARRAASRYF